MADTDDPDLRERVAELEATVEAQQETIQQLLPSRRRVLQAGGLLAGGGVLGALTADRASADVTGQVGTQQDRVDVFGGAVDANSVNAIALSHNLEDGSDESGSRSLDTEYQNTTGRTLLANVRLRVSATGETFQAYFEVGNSSGLGVNSNLQDGIKTDASRDDEQQVLTAIVPDGGYYQIETFADNQSNIDLWFERAYK